ncbi:MAG TPA: HAMP domain-containing sensor histidine kinase [Vicinamibacterales bacterium]|jgi:signal transduction histidine kinase|nr:HAMP domain-containing sensor histidine kinase [Vicinamibacterales bacterium]
MLTTAESYAAIVAQRVTMERLTLAEQWLGRLRELLTVELNDVFPSDQLLDHIPLLIANIATYLRAPADEEIAANAAVIDKARELGLLRHEQKASVHQLLREYEVLEEILEAFVSAETQRLGLQPTSEECFEVVRRLTRSIRTLMRTTVDTFVSEYTTTLQERNERIRAFNRMTSHELRNPIGTLLFAAAALTNERVRSDPARLDKVTSTIRSNAERLSWLVDNLQRLARLGDPLDVPSQQHIELEGLAGEVARQLEEMAAARAVSIRIGPGLPTLFGDPAHLELILLNLVSNAIKYSDPEKPECFVEIAVCGDARAEDVCTVCIRDNGLGIADVDQPAVFDRFFRAHAHLDQELGNSGSGLGLAIAVECVKALRGSIRCESAVGHGTTFFVTLPRREPQSPAPASAAAS